MKKLLLTMLFTGICEMLFAQNLAKISGFVFDSVTNKPVEYANVALLKEGKVVAGTTCNDKGNFVLNKIADGVYQLKITFVGFQDKWIDSLKMTEGNSIGVGVIRFSPIIKSLNEVMVVGEKALFEDKNDRLVYNAEKDISIKGGTATDVLRKIPMLSVDLDGNVELRGSSNIKVLINNKPSTIMANSIADALKQIPADAIKSVEVITAPSAKYDAEGSAGVINIITKKNSLQGVSGSVSPSFGRWGDYHSLNLNYRYKSFGISGYGGSNQWNTIGNAVLTRQTFEDKQTSIFNQKSSYTNNGNNLYENFTADYDIDSLNHFSAGINSFNGNFYTHFGIDNNFELQNAENQYYRRNTNRNQHWGNYTLNFEYTHNFKKPKKEFSILAMTSSNHQNSDYDLAQLTDSQLINYREMSNNLSHNRESTIQTDFTQPVDSVSTLEIGAKLILRNVDSDYRLSAAIDGSTNFVNDPSRADVFDYAQQVTSGYFTYARQTKKKWGFNVGMRYENTALQSDFKSTNTSFSDNYGNFIPNISLSKGLKKDQKIRISYNQRIQRPQQYFLNPYVNYSDPKNITFGNPYLKPELTHSLEANYSIYFKENSINASLFMRRTNNAIESIRTVDNQGVASITFDNIAQNAAYGVNLSGTTKFLKKISLNGSANVYYNVLNSPALQASNESWMYRLNLTGSVDFGKGFKAQLYSFFQSRRVTLQGLQGSYGYYVISMQKEVLKKKGSISLGLDNPFSETREARSDFYSSSFEQHSVNTYYQRGWRLSFNYQFGKMSTNKRNKKSIKNDDAKGGENN